MNTYNGTGGANVSSNGNVNFSPSERALQAGLANVFRNHPDAIVLDGDDDWYAPLIEKVHAVLEEAKVKRLAGFHSGISGYSTSGAVLSAKDLNKIVRAFNRLAKNPENLAHSSPYRGFQRSKPIGVNIYFADGTKRELRTKV